MTPAEEGAYIRLLCYCWNDPDCSIPANDGELAVLSRLNEGWLNGGSKMVRKCFEPHPTIADRLTNFRLLQERKKQDEWSKKSKEGGVKSGKQRRKKPRRVVEGWLKGGSRVVEPNGNSSSSSSSSCIPTTSGAKAPDKSFFDSFALAYQQSYHVSYRWKRPKDFAQFSELRRTASDDLTADRWGQALVNYFATPQSSHTLADLCVRFDTFQAHKLNEYGKPCELKQADASVDPFYGKIHYRRAKPA